MLPQFVTFAAPGDPETLTGGYIYNARIIVELRKLGLSIDVLRLGEGFPYPNPAIIRHARKALAEAACKGPVIVDGLALGVLPEAAQKIAEISQLIALVHHPLALETGTAVEMAAKFKKSECAALAQASQIIATSAPTAEILVADYGVAREKLMIIRPGNDPVPFSEGSGQAKLCLLAVAAISPRKGFDILIAALANLREFDWQLIIIGDTSRSPETMVALQTQIEQAQLVGRIYFMGKLSAAELERHYLKADAFVLASHYEGYGMAYAEALAHGLPVIGTTGGAIASVIPRSAGILVPPGKASLLEEALRLIFGDQKMRQGLRQGAREAARNLPCWEESAALFHQLLTRSDRDRI